MDRTNHLNPHLTYARVKGLEGIREIVLRYEVGLLVPVSYADDYDKVDGTLMNRLDAEGNGLMLVSHAAVVNLYTDDEADQIWEAEHADAQLLSFAR